MFVTKLILEKKKNTKNSYILNSDLIWEDPEKTIVVPKGFKTDLTTYWIEGRHTSAAILHDYLLSIGACFKEANHIFNKALKLSRISWIHRKTIMFFVTIHGWYQDWKNKDC